MVTIETACGRSDIFARYGDHTTLPVVGWDDRGRAVVQKPDRATVLATRARLGERRFRCVGTPGEVD